MFDIDSKHTLKQLCSEGQEGYELNAEKNLCRDFEEERLLQVVTKLDSLNNSIRTDGKLFLPVDVQSQ